MTTPTFRARAVALLSLLTSTLTAPALTAQVRITGSTSLRYIELRPFVRDSVSSGTTTGTGLLRQLPDGRIVRCIPGESYCYDVRPGEVASTVPVIQDLSVSAWGFGHGLRLYSQLRGRSALGGNRELWPREDDHVEVMSLYGEMERGMMTLRAGRQWRVSGLGFYNFDGVAVALRPKPTTLIEAYGGRSLVRGLNEGRTSGALEAIEALSASNTGILFGLQGRYRPNSRIALGAMYQLDVRSDRTGAYSELAAANGTLRLGRGSVEGSVEVDLAGRALNDARLTMVSAPIGHASLFAEARRYHPYFELWTIWGAFSPVGFDEVKGGVTWTSSSAKLIARGAASYRRYGDAATDSPDEFRTSGWGLGAAVNYRPAPLWSMDGSYRIEAGFGAARWDGQAGLRRELAGIGDVALQGVAFQRLYEFRLDEGTVVGVGGAGSLAVGERGRLFASAMLYRQHGGGASVMNWNQRRVSVRFEWTVGSEPGAAVAGARR